MRITRLETILLTVPLPEVLHWSGGEADAVNSAFVRVHTDEGVTGLGECYNAIFVPEAVKAAVEAMESVVVGADPADVGAIYHALYSKTLFWGRTGLGVSAAGAIETAVWDVLGKARGVPVYRLLGGAVHSRLPVYASGGMDISWDELREEMERHRANGFRAVKIRIGNGRERDVEKVRRIREMVGPEFRIMVDAVQGHNPRPWSAYEALEVGRAIAPYGIDWFEEPCAATDYEGYAHVRRKGPLAVAGGESSYTIHEFKRFFAAEALDIAQPDAAQSGGIQECRRIATLAEAFGVKLAFHCWASSVTVAANYHVAFTVPNCCYVEYPAWGYALSDDLFVERPIVRDGFVYPGSAPGLGVDIPDAVLEKYAYRRGSGVKMYRAGELTG